MPTAAVRAIPNPILACSETEEILVSGNGRTCATRSRRTEREAHVNERRALERHGHPLA